MKFSKLIWHRKWCGAMRIQAFSKQETPMVRIWTDDGADGTGYSYTIGTGGSAVVAMLRDYMAPWLLGRDAEMVEEIWKGLFFSLMPTRPGDDGP